MNITVTIIGSKNPAKKTVLKCDPYRFAEEIRGLHADYIHLDVELFPGEAPTEIISLAESIPLLNVLFSARAK